MKKKTVHLKTNYEFGDGEERIVAESAKLELLNAIEKSIKLPASARKFVLTVQLVTTEKLDPEDMEERQEKLEQQLTLQFVS